ncbi:hypothetical protein GCM10025768_03800 [Microbacterium pseudoresistens]|uniref:hypothetical protein n=1 Tax=Microbacterium pseudoresistens TaxID=640634 RepID=UPI0015C96FE7|nr:hypothetical protein [Microbacterium pseudoresistens]
MRNGEVEAALGKVDAALAADEDATHWQGVDFPWSSISGVGDGSRSFVLHLRDAAASRASLGRADYLVKDGSTPGTGSATLLLDGVTDAETFKDAATRLIQEAERRGLPTQARVG